MYKTALLYNGFAIAFLNIQLDPITKKKHINKYIDDGDCIIIHFNIIIIYIITGDTLDNVGHNSCRLSIRVVLVLFVLFVFLCFISILLIVY